MSQSTKKLDNLLLADRYMYRIKLDLKTPEFIFIDPICTQETFKPCQSLHDRIKEELVSLLHKREVEQVRRNSDNMLTALTPEDASLICKHVPVENGNVTLHTFQPGNKVLDCTEQSLKKAETWWETWLENFNRVWILLSKDDHLLDSYVTSESVVLCQENNKKNVRFGCQHNKLGCSLCVPEMKDEKSMVRPTTHGSQAQVILQPASKFKTSRISSFSFKNLGKNVSIRHGCIMPNGNLLLSDYKNKCIYSCTVNGSEMKKIKLPSFPTVITIYNPHVALVATSSGIYSINLSSLTLDKPVKAGACWALCSAEGKIWTGIKDVLCKITINGEVQDTFSLPFEIDDICVSTTGKIYLLESSENVVYQISTDGKHTTLFENIGLQSIIGLCLGNDENLFISEPMGNNIHYITRNGQHNEVFLNAADGILRPVGLAFNCESKHLIVLNENGTSVNTYIMQ